MGGAPIRALCSSPSTVTNDQTPGFSTLWANMLSCMPEADFLIRARHTKEHMSGSPESKRLFETEMVRPPLRAVPAASGGMGSSGF